jgi:hypothetical protein
MPPACWVSGLAEFSTEPPRKRALRRPWACRRPVRPSAAGMGLEVDQGRDRFVRIQLLLAGDGPKVWMDR